MNRHTLNILTILLSLCISVIAFARSESTKVLQTDPNDSVLVITGEIDMGSATYVSVHPVFPPPHLLFSDAPYGCDIRNNFWDQIRTYDTGYKYYYIFKDTANKTNCWNYFKNITTITANITQVEVAENSNWDKKKWPLSNPGPKTFTVTQVVAKGPSGD